MSSELLYLKLLHEQNPGSIPCYSAPIQQEGISSQMQWEMEPDIEFINTLAWERDSRYQEDFMAQIYK